MKRETFNLMRPFALKAVGLVVALVILPPAIILGILRKGWSGFFSVPFRKLPPALMYDSQWGTHRYVHLPGLKMHYVENGDRSNPLMIFVHGFPAFWFSWRHQLDYFSKDYWCIAIDCRGYGDTDKPSGIHNYDINVLADDISNLAKALKCDTFTLVGHDWGGMIGYQVCLRHPEMVKQFIACNIPHGRAMAEALGEGWAQIMKSWYIYFFQCPFVPEFFLRWGDFPIFDKTFESMKVDLQSASDEIESYKFTFRDRGSFTAPLNYYRHMLQYGTPDMKPVTATPVLQIWGTEDVALDLSTARRTKKYVKHLEERYLEGVSHWVQMEEPNKVNEAIEQYLNNAGK